MRDSSPAAGRPRHCCPAPARPLLLLFLLATASAGVGAQVVPYQPPKNNGVGACYSMTQCYLTKLGAPRTQGEWMTAYAGALHEHCAALLEYGGPTDCSSSVRCVYLRPDGSTNSSSSHTSQVNASFLAATNSSSSSGGRPGHATAAFWRSVAPVLRLEQPACVLLPVSLDSVRYRACASAQPPASPDAVAQHCQESPAACFVRNASDAADFESWWLGPSPQQHLEDSSSWKDAGRLQRVASECMQAWAAKGKLVTDTCATRGIGASPWNNSLMLNRVLVALVDAFESSGCNNTVTYSEAMAVQRILDDLCTSTPGCKAAQAASAGAAAARLSLLPVLGVTVLAGWWVVVAP